MNGLAEWKGEAFYCTIYWNVLVHTGIYQYALVHTGTCSDILGYTKPNFFGDFTQGLTQGLSLGLSHWFVLVYTGIYCNILVYTWILDH